MVAVLDTGIDTDHPDLADDLLSEECYLAAPGLSSACPDGSTQQRAPGAAEDDSLNGHGSHVSGIITSGGVVGPPGVAPDAGISAYKVLDALADGVASDVLAAANHIIINYPGTDLVNLSLGTALFAPGTCDGLIPAVDAAINTLRAGGTTIFAASHNQSPKTSMTYPACISTVVSEGAMYDANLGGSIGGFAPTPAPPRTR